MLCYIKYNFLCVELLIKATLQAKTPCRSANSSALLAVHQPAIVPQPTPPAPHPRVAEILIPRRSLILLNRRRPRLPLILQPPLRLLLIGRGFVILGPQSRSLLHSRPILYLLPLLLPRWRHSPLVAPAPHHDSPESRPPPIIANPPGEARFLRIPPR